jgi:hypothetical protein
MKNTTLLQFSNLTELATYIKTVHPDTYLINTMKLTLLASLTAFEVAIAVEQYSAEVVPQKVEA